MELTRSFTADQFARALESWDRADIQGKQPLFTSPFGDMFFRAQDGFWFLDLLEGLELLFLGTSEIGSVPDMEAVDHCNVVEARARDDSLRGSVEIGGLVHNDRRIARSGCDHPLP